MNRFFLRPLLGLCFVLLATKAAAHPIPDVPVRASFEDGGACRIQVEVDPRCFDLDPEIAPYLLNSALKTMPEAERAALLAQAGEFLKRTADFHFEPSGAFTPEFKFEFTTHNAQPLTKDDDPVVMTGNWSATVPTGSKGYQIYARPEGKLSVLFLNSLRGKEVSRTMVLFPKEKSFMLDLIGNSHELPPEKPAGSTTSAAGSGDDRTAGVTSLLKQGFLQVVARGYDFILFVLAMFLLGRGFKELFPQLVVFVGAHSLGLWLEALHGVHVPASIAQAGIAVGVIVLALANVLHSQCTWWRVALVAVFGLFPGFVLAHSFAALTHGAASLTLSLLGFHLGVELGLLAIIVVALLVTAWAGNARLFRWAVAVPGSVAVAAVGLWAIVGRIGWLSP
ncbi:HupE/UreJ family protein [Roseimicrobium gellanilyticum]|nr:HupE/UreJ family protein [Roseimicrobium gellanilyticum]